MHCFYPAVAYRSVLKYSITERGFFVVHYDLVHAGYSVLRFHQK